MTFHVDVEKSITYYVDTMKIKNNVKFGNKKLPDSTMIFNCGSASNCPSKALGLCQAGSACYAMKAEIQYPDCLPYRNRQRYILTKYDGKTIGNALLGKLKRRRNDTYAFRFNESGDFENQQDVDKMATICSILKDRVSCYGFTARTDLNLRPLLKHANVMVSNDKYKWVNKGANRFKIVTSFTGKHSRCAGDCRVCDLCLTLNGKTIEVMKH